MCNLVTQNAVIRLAKRRERERVGGRAVEDEEYFAILLKDFAKQVRSTLRPSVIAVADLVIGIGLLQGSPRLGTDPGIIVAGEVAAD